MAAKPRGKPFAKGQSGNPPGSSKLAKYRAQARAQAKLLGPQEVCEAISELLRGKLGDVPMVAHDKDISSLKGILAMLLVSCAKKGNVQGFLSIVQQVTGKPKETVEHTGPGGGPMQSERVTMTYEQKMQRLETLRQQREALEE